MSVIDDIAALKKYAEQNTGMPLKVVYVGRSIGCVPREYVAADLGITLPTGFGERVENGFRFVEVRGQTAMEIEVSRACAQDRIRSMQRKIGQ